MIRQRQIVGTDAQLVIPFDPKELGPKISYIWKDLRSLASGMIYIVGSTAIALRIGRDNFRLPRDLDLAFIPSTTYQAKNKAVDAIEEIYGIETGEYKEELFWDRYRWGETDRYPKLDLFMPSFPYTDSQVRGSNFLPVAQLVDLLACKYLCKFTRNLAADQDDIQALENVMSHKLRDAAIDKFRKFSQDWYARNRKRPKIVNA